MTHKPPVARRAERIFPRTVLSLALNCILIQAFCSMVTYVSSSANPIWTRCSKPELELTATLVQKVRKQGHIAYLPLPSSITAPTAPGWHC